MNKTVPEPDMLPIDDGPPPSMFQPKARSESDRALIDAAIASGKVTVCPGFGAGRVNHHTDRFVGMSGAQYRAALKSEKFSIQKEQEKFRKASSKQEGAPAPKGDRDRDKSRQSQMLERSKAAYDMRKNEKKGWGEIADALGFSSRQTAHKSARAHARRNELEWPLSDGPISQP